ncbi:SRPBCC family protein [Euzebya sp.]|uniref:SRPBCC family protein n=1 Tax=Euzebya sp. TaxID=1971409 RepID=UPI00351558D4
MREYMAETWIDAPPEVVWEVLSDGPGYAGWDNGVVEVEGTIAESERISVRSEVQPGRAFRLRVSDVEPARGMTWQDGMPLGLFSGRRRFALEPERGGTAFSVREVFSGPLAGLVTRSMPDLQPSFDTFASGLKAEAEGRVRG